MVDSCQECAACKRGEEQMCKKQVQTYNGVDHSGRAATPGRKTTIGGYTDKHVVHENFAINIPKSYPMEAAGPIMCAGATMYDPLERYGAKAGTKVAVVGLGGLGVLGIQLAVAMGCDVTAISRSASKQKKTEAMGVKAFLNSSDPKAMAASAGKFEIILNTIPSNFDYRIYQRLVSPGGRHVIIGISSVFMGATMLTGFLGDRSPITTSMIAGIPNTQAVIDLCAKKKILPPFQVRPVSDLASIYESLDQSNDAGMRYVLDIAGTLNDGSFDACSKVAAPKLEATGSSPSMAMAMSNFLSMFTRTMVGSYSRANRIK
jgi:D-arabinose 1-dehydrogenase-like Zn-dependent alcohol dehydrogenase